MNNRKSIITLVITLLALCLFAIGCNVGGGSTNSPTNNATSNTGKKSDAGNSPSPATNAEPSASPLPLPQALSGESSYLQTAQNVREKIGQRYTYTCPPNVKLYDGVYSSGTDIYYTGSSICSAAIHAGIITQAKGGQVLIEIKPAASTYYTASAERNGVTPRSMSFNDQKDNGSFAFVSP